MLALFQYLISFITFSLHEIMVILIFLTHVLPKLFKIWGNIKQIRFIYAEAINERKGQPHTPMFYILTIVKIVSDVFLTDRKEMLMKRQVNKIEKDVAEALTILRASNPQFAKQAAKTPEVDSKKEN